MTQATQDDQTARIRSLLDECRSEARGQGWDGDDADYEYTEADLEYVTDELGYRPTREEWQAAGLAWVGGRHVGDTEKLDRITRALREHGSYELGAYKQAKTMADRLQIRGLNVRVSSRGPGMPRGLLVLGQ